MVKKVIWYEFLLKKLDTNILFNQNIGIGEIVNIEYVSANPTGPLHIGHCRGAVFGDVLANLLESTGFNVVKEYYINDAGSQIDLLAKSVILRIEELQSNKKIDSFPAELYPGEYLIDVAQSIIKSHGEDIHQRDDYFELVKSQTVHLLLEGIKSDLSLIEQYNATIKDLCNIYNVPVQLLNNTDSTTYNNMKEAKKALYQNAVIPELNKIRDELNRWLAPKYGEKLYIDFDFTVIPELQEEMDKVVQQLSQSWWLTMNEKRFFIYK